MEYFVISAKFVPLKYYTLSSQLRRLTSFSVGCSGRRILSPGQIAVMRKWSIRFKQKGRHCCSVGELKITFASTCKESVFNVLFNVLFLVLDFPLGAPNTLLKHVIERSIWRIVVGEGSWWGWGFSQDWWLGFWSCWSLSLTAVFWIDFSVACFKRV